jgi:hypothetical protein
MKKKNFSRILLGATLVLLVPLVAMQFSEDVDWKLGDFVIIGTLLVGAGLIFEFLSTRVNAKNRIFVAAIVVLAVMLIWVELAVGLFGSPIAGS